MKTKIISSKSAFLVFLFIGIVIVLAAITSGNAQALTCAGLTTTDLNDLTPTDLANILLGEGITISNVTYTGNNAATGKFTCGTGILNSKDTNVDFESGIILSSGKIADVIGPNNADNTSSGFGTSGDSDLQSLIPYYETFDAAVLEFDFIPTGNAITFQYAFASEEYNEYANRAFNNVFGFFVNGVNYALLPDGVTVVSINNVNGGSPSTCTNGIDDDGDGLVDVNDPDCITVGDNIVGEDNHNSTYYINNDCSDPDGGSYCPINIEADGLTRVLTFIAQVNANQTNHMKIGIADAGDSIYDSWVFIKAGSFRVAENCYNNIDDDGDGLVDISDPDCDADKDGYISTANGGNDCNDLNASIHPGATEVCNDVDDNCNGQVDESCETPQPPTLISPTDGETTVATNPTFSWNASAGADSYGLEVSSDPTFPDDPNKTKIKKSGIVGTSYQETSVTLFLNTIYYWRVNATNANGTSDWSNSPTFWNFRMAPFYGNLFESLKGKLDPDDDSDGIDDTDPVKGEGVLGTTGGATGKKTLFVRPKLENLGDNPPLSITYNYWPGFITLFPTGGQGFAGIPAFTQANIEIVVIGPTCCTSPNLNACGSNGLPITVGVGPCPSNCHTYLPFDCFNYNPANDPNHPPVDIMEIIYKPTGYCAGCSHAGGHTYFESTALTWYWDTKGLTPSTPGLYAYKTPQLFGYPLDRYFEEGAYSSLWTTAAGTDCSSVSCTELSTMNLNSDNPNTGSPDGTVEFNGFTFNSNGSIASKPSPLSPATGYDRDTVLRRTIVHEMGHALLNGLDSDHCADPNCIMYSGVSNWNPNNFGPGDCVHRSGGSKDIRANGIIHNGLVIPPAPTLSSPANGATGVSKSPTLRWNTMTVAASYKLQVSLTQDFSSPTTYSGITGTSYQVTGLSGSKTYYWRVNASNALGTGNWSSIWNFKTVK